MTSPDNLKGSLQTMDCYLGPTQCRAVYEGRLKAGLLSREGWAVVDDSTSPLLDAASDWRVERNTRPGWRPDDVDWFFFGRGTAQTAYRDTLADFAVAAGGPVLMPASAYGVWWSRYWTYDQAGIEASEEEHTITETRFRGFKMVPTTAV